MKLLILGVAGTFMTGIARVACQLGHQVEGVDDRIYPPMSDVLSDLGIVCHEGYEASLLDNGYDLIVVGNVCSRGQPIIESMLTRGSAYTSAPAWLFDNVLKYRRVIAVSGTHGKSTTTSLLVSMMYQAGRSVGYLVGAKMNDLKWSADLGNDPYFIIEADEYDTAFFDKRSKFLHYRPEALVINHLEFDHADIFSSLSDIKKVFRQLLSILPPNGLLVTASDVDAIDEMIDGHLWSPHQRFGIHSGHWQAREIDCQGASFDLYYHQVCLGKIQWPMFGLHNVRNALAAASIAHYCGLNPNLIVTGLSHFSGLKRRMEYKGEVNGIDIYDDFAHHPTAIHESISGLKPRVKAGRLVVLLQLASYTMCSGTHGKALIDALSLADAVFIVDVRQIAGDRIRAQLSSLKQPHGFYECTNELLDALNVYLAKGDCLLCMGNKDLGDVFKLINSNH